MKTTLCAHVEAVEIRESKTGKKYLSIKAQPIGPKGEPLDVQPIWVISYHNTHMAADVRPGMGIRAEGALDPHIYEKDGRERCTMRRT